MEISVIADMRASGARLTNASDGGTRGPVGAKHTEEWKSVQSALKTGRPSPNAASHHAALNAAKLGIPRSAETRAKISASKTDRKLGPRPRDVVEKIAAVQRGRAGKRGADSPRFRRDIDTWAIVHAWLDGESQRSIARRLGTSQANVHRRIYSVQWSA
jgi:hypothetical protein